MFAVAQYRVKKIHKNGGYENRDILFSTIKIFHHADFKAREECTQGFIGPELHSVVKILACNV